ncbi:hypothetical protein J2I47_03165 [Fibrella sp. HMF5335]|uniref:Uncharacterized protein n=1 Tax=Fibrella rubiginis TaxID=2817060 RepID=A0A939GDJ2_9BACT|nr:hypothetical protein [Fibrella rubiginis]MBO0935540.1 hypothetical protein [Fibrella rubiginis]
MMIRLFWLLLIATIGYSVFMNRSIAPLTSKEVVAYELARTPDQATVLLGQMSLRGKDVLLSRSIFLDFLFLCLYGTTLFVGCRYAAQLLAKVDVRKTWITWVNRLAWLGIVAAVFDAIENGAMLQQLPPASATTTTAHLAWAMALLKFSCIAVVLFIAATGFGYYGLKRLSDTKRPMLW